MDECRVGSFREFINSFRGELVTTWMLEHVKFTVASQNGNFMELYHTSNSILPDDNLQQLSTAKKVC